MKEKSVKDYFNDIKMLYDIFLEDEKDEMDNRYAFIAEDLFDYTTYDYEMAALIGRDVIEVLKVIVNGETFEYIKTNNKKYLMICDKLINKNIIDWGTSIRGAWLNVCTELKTCNGDKFTLTAEILNELIEWVD